MHLRAVLSSLLAVLLLSTYSLGSACEVRCELARQGMSCHDTGVEKGAANETSMSGMRGMSVAMPAAGHTGHVPYRLVSFEQASCGHHACTQSPALLPSAHPLLVHVALREPIFVLLSAMLWPPRTTADHLERRPPPFRQASPVSRRTTLRV